MQAALSGYLTIWSVIGLGWVVAHFRVLNEQSRRVLARLAFSVASPALLFSLVSRAELGHLFSRTVVVSALAILIAAAVAALAGRLWLGRQTASETVVNLLCSAYTNAGNLGLPIAAYVLGDMTWMAPILLLQTALLQPTALAILDHAARPGPSNWRRYLALPFRNPITLATLAGFALNSSGWQLPALFWAPIDMVGQMAVPAMLIAFGISLRLDALPGRGPQLPALVLVATVKVLVHPLAALLLGLAWGLDQASLLAVTVIAALPTAQNVYLIASRYRVRTLLARDAVFVTTIASVPVIVAAASWLG